jgi:2-C-methyl-D-erythritol 4-phosphate cytidylyltransferase / 2-C-methyl-D-erythritol 2,4-cyclodiphosphate synthase
MATTHVLTEFNAGVTAKALAMVGALSSCSSIAVFVVADTGVSRAHNAGPSVARPMTRVAALIVAAGRGLRAAANSGAGPKQYVPLNGTAMLAHTLKPFIEHARVDIVKVVIHADDLDRYAGAIAALGSPAKLLQVAIGGADRQASVHSGLQSLGNSPPSIVMIHDAARPFVSEAMITTLIEAMENNKAAILATQLSDTLKRASAGKMIEETIPRAGLWRAETPQAFRYEQISKVHSQAAREARHDFTDDASMAEWAGIPVKIVESGGGNMKITTPQDIVMAEERLSQSTPLPLPDIRTGQGFDVHKFKDGSFVWICGVKIPHSKGVDAHSDGDVGLHALTDALLGTIADGDIGVHFRNDDERWRNAASGQFVLEARRRVQAAGGHISNIDITILCESPKISKYRDDMRRTMADLVGIDMSRVSVKATTTETLGFTGRREGLAAMATATVLFR